MSTTRRVGRIRALSPQTNIGSALPLLREPGDTVLIHRSVDRSLVMRCPCGCGDDLVLNLDSRAGPAWRLYARAGKLTVFPSYWRNSGCESHFIIWKDRIYWCGGRDDDEYGYADSTLEQEILAKTPSSRFVEYRELAEVLDAIPWDVLWVCRVLVKRGLLQEQPGKVTGRFRAIASVSESQKK